MRHERETASVTCFLEESQAGDESDEGGFGMRVQKADDEQEHPRHGAETVDENFLPPQRAGVAVDGVADDTARGPKDKVQETKHGSPISGAGLAESGEFLGVVSAEDGVDAELGSERAEIGYRKGQGRERQDRLGGPLDRGLLDQFPTCRGEEIVFLRLRFREVALAADRVEFDGVVG